MRSSWYRVGADSVDDWFNHDGELAADFGAGWRFVEPFVGLRLTERETGLEWRFTIAGWEVGRARVNELYAGGQKVVGVRADAIPDTVGGSVVDGEARAVIAEMLSALRGHGLIDS